MLPRKYLSVALAFAMLFLHSPAHGQCAADEVKTGEDADNFYCTKKSEIACVKAAGVQLSQDQKACVDNVFPLCEGANKPDQTEAEHVQCIKSCVNHLAEGMDALSSCAHDCTIDSVVNEVQRNVCDVKLNDCFETVLQKHKKRTEACEKD